MSYTDGVITTQNFPDALVGGDGESVPAPVPQEQEELPARFPAGSPAGKLERWAQKTNLTSEFTEDQLDKIGADAVRDYGLDESSRDDWKADMEAAFDLALQVTKEGKSYPWPGAANVVYPLLTTAALQFNARAYAAMVNGPNIVRGKVNGADPDNAKHERAGRIGRHMSWQLLEQMDEWEEETDRELMQVPIVGCAFKKTYWDESLERPVSRLVSAMDFVVNDETTKSLESCPRMTELCRYYRHEIETMYRRKLWREIEIQYDEEDRQKTELFLEQTVLLDLDEDDYPEPYTLTVHEETQKVVRITACFQPEGIEADDSGEIIRIERDDYYTKIPFLPHPKGRFYDLGFGFLLKFLNKTINTTINQLMDAGHLANLPSGYIGRGPEMRAGHMRFRPGEYKFINSPGGVIRDAIVQNQFSGPNVVLFSLLEYLVNAAQQITSVQDVLMGDTDPQTQPTTLLARIEQAQKQMVTIFKRIHRARKKEYQKLYRLNRLHMDEQEYFTFQDEREAIPRADYEDKDLDISPASDPTMISDTQKMAKAQAVYQWAQSSPFANQGEASIRFLRALGVDDPEALLQEPGPDPQLELEMGKLKIEHGKLMNAASDAAIKRAKALPEILEILAKAEKAASEGEATMVGMQLQDIQTFRDLIMSAHQMDMEMLNAVTAQQQPANQQGGLGAMGGQSGHSGGEAILPGLGGQAQAGMGGLPSPAAPGQSGAIPG